MCGPFFSGFVYKCFTFDRIQGYVIPRLGPHRRTGGTQKYPGYDLTTGSRDLRGPVRPRDDNNRKIIESDAKYSSALFLKGGRNGGAKRNA